MAFLPDKYRRSKELDVEEIYIHEECSGRSAKLSVKYTSKDGQLGWVFQCWSCKGLPNGLAGFHADNGKVNPGEARRVFDKYMQLQDMKQKASTQTVNLPDDFRTTLDQESLRYILKTGLTVEDIAPYRIGYSESYQRMIVPVYNGPHLLAWQGRYLGDDPKQPKHITVAATARSDIFYWKTVEMAPRKDSLVVVESALSAIKLAKAYPTLGLLGSAIPAASWGSILPLFKHYYRVIIWLDPDKKAEAIKMAMKLRALGLDARILLTDNKPKWYPVDVAEDLINRKELE
jgi:hypothetical protein